MNKSHCCTDPACLVVLPGALPHEIPDLSCARIVCDTDWHTHDCDHIVTLDLMTAAVARAHSFPVWTRARWCRSHDSAVPDWIVSVSTAAIWAAHLISDHVIIAGGDAWLAAPDASLDWTGQTVNTYTWVTPTMRLGRRTQSLDQLQAKYQCGGQHSFQVNDRLRIDCAL